MTSKRERGRKKAQKPDSNPLGFLTIAALAVAYIASPAKAEIDAPGEGGVQSTDVKSTIEEIVVVAKRRSESAAPASDVNEDPLREPITRHVREHGQLEQELEWRTSSSTLAIQLPQLYLGYDPREDDRSANPLSSGRLPLDVVTPATVFRVHF